MALTSRMPDNWAGLKLAMALRRLVTMRMEPAGALDVERWRLRMRLHPRDNGCEKNLLFTPQMYEPPEREELARDIARIGATAGPSCSSISAPMSGCSRCSSRPRAHRPHPRHRAGAGNSRGSPQHRAESRPEDHAARAGARHAEGTAFILLNGRDRAAPACAGGTQEGGVEVRCRPLLSVVSEAGLTASMRSRSTSKARGKVLVRSSGRAGALWPA